MAYYNGKKTKPITYYGTTSPGQLLARPKHQHRPVMFTRSWAQPTPHTFTMPPVQELLSHYVPKRYAYKWADPFCGDHSPAAIWYKNDHNPDRGPKGTLHMDVLEFAAYLREDLRGELLDGVLFDPPYSFRQISEHYKVVGRKATKADTSMAFYEKARSALCDLVAPCGYAISFGWNTNGFGVARGFRVVEILAIAHGGSRNDTLVVVEQKMTHSELVAAGML